LHVLSTPPAFVLSQDQTLQQTLDKLSRQSKLPKESPKRGYNWHWLIKHPVEFSRNKHPPLLAAISATSHPGQLLHFT
jgi:hypothetical protein